MDQSLRCKLCFRRALSSSILPFNKVGTKFTQLKNESRVPQPPANPHISSELSPEPSSELS